MIKFKSLTKKLILEGGAYGHLSHPYEDPDLTFGNMKKMIDSALEGKLDKEEDPTLKIDGQNLYISYVNGESVAARNKTEIKNGGIGLEELAEKFSFNENVQKGFTIAFAELSDAIIAIDENILNEIFENGKKWLNFEIVYADSKNVIYYDNNFLVFHGINLVDERGNTIDVDKKSAEILHDIIMDYEQDINRTFKIKKPIIAKLKPIDFGNKAIDLKNEITKLQRKYGLSDKDTMQNFESMYMEDWFKIEAKKSNYKLSKNILSLLLKRYVYNQKSVNFTKIKKMIDNDNFLNKIINLDKNYNRTIKKEIYYDLEIVFLKLGIEVLKGLQTFLVVNKDEAKIKLAKDLNDTIKKLEKGNVEDLENVQQHLKKIEDIGGIKSIMPEEGIVFKFDGKYYKLTGSFAPANRILGYYKFKK